MKVIAIRGKKKTGKTFLIELLTQKFKEKGLKVGVIKHAHESPDFDREGKDSFRFKNAGAESVCLLWNEGTVLWFKEEKRFEEILSQFQGMDIIFVEGLNHLSIPSVEILEEGEKPSDNCIFAVKRGKIDESLEDVIQAIETFRESIKPAGELKMIDVSEKIETLRTAKASCLVTFSPELWDKIKEGKLEKGDIIQAARVGAINGAKSAYKNLLLCHPAPIDYIGVEVKPSYCQMEILVEVKGVGRTGMEMEAMAGAMNAALSIYDILKRHGEGVKIYNVQLLEKRGGKRDYEKERIPFSAAVITISDRASRGERIDESGEIIKKWVCENGGELRGYEIIPDEVEEIEEKVKSYALSPVSVDLIITTGGTGPGPRDVTVKALEKIAEKKIEGIGELMRRFGERKTLNAALSSGTGYVVGKSIVLTLPGSPKGVKDSLKIVENIIFHAIKMARGEGH
jgi:molybdenum cofactor biosynthesis protein MoaC/molybdopterin-guanine dinucleotide biosynthesis protein MobB